ncbi:hypothetical protein AB0A94_03910 [Streptomyces sp. NPDC044984]|uniref:hypothetical protein n=1 Tax=Streptomyces sp. NPDC044984 TaxID=3154335 RepID=UPI003410951B
MSREDAEGSPEDCAAVATACHHAMDAGAPPSITRPAVELPAACRAGIPQDAEAVADFVGVGGSAKDGVGLPRRAGEHHVVGYGENVDNPTIDVISAEINFIGDLVGPHDDLCGPMVLAARGRVCPHTAK